MILFSAVRPPAYRKRGDAGKDWRDGLPFQGKTEIGNDNADLALHD
jgi:hypothetical protein